jgi:hypothetical protein
VQVCRDIVFLDRLLDGALLIRLVKNDPDELSGGAPDVIDRPGVVRLLGHCEGYYRAPTGGRLHGLRHAAFAGDVGAAKVSGGRRACDGRSRAPRGPRLRCLENRPGGGAGFDSQSASIRRRPLTITDSGLRHGLGRRISPICEGMLGIGGSG